MRAVNLPRPVRFLDKGRELLGPFLGGFDNFLRLGQRGALAARVGGDEVSRLALVTFSQLGWMLVCANALPLLRLRLEQWLQRTLDRHIFRRQKVLSDCILRKFPARDLAEIDNIYGDLSPPKVAARGQAALARDKYGRLLVEAKAALPHGTFISMVEAELPFSRQTAHRLMSIADDPRLSNDAHGPHLPQSWRTLYEPTKLDDDAFAMGASCSRFHPM